MKTKLVNEANVVYLQTLAPVDGTLNNLVDGNFSFNSFDTPAAQH